MALDEVSQAQQGAHYRLPMLPRHRRRILRRAEFGTSAQDADIVTVRCRARRDVPLDPFALHVDGGKLGPEYHALAARNSISLPDAFVTLARNVRVCGYGLMVTSDDYLLHESNIRRHHAIMEGRDVCRIEQASPPKATRRVAEPTIILTRVWPLHFSHWMYDNLGALTFVRELGLLTPSVRIAVGHGNRRGGWFKAGSVQADSLALLGIRPEQVLPLGEHTWTHFDNAIIPWPVNEFRQPIDRIFNQPEIFDLFRAMREQVAPGDRPAERKVFFSRLDTPLRRLKNEAEIIELVKPLGFEALTTGGMSLAEQIRLYADVSIAIGPIGNSLMGLCFMRPGSTVVVLTPEPLAYCLAYYQSFCSALGLRLLAVVSTDFDQGRWNETPWQLAPDLVARVLGEQGWCR